MPLPRSFARFNRRFANPVVRLVAGRLPPLGLVRHSGRRTGRSYATPVLAFGTSGDLVIALVYGARSDWVQNVVTAGRAEVVRFGKAREYSEPRLAAADEGLRLVPAILRPALRLVGVHDCLVMKELPRG